MKYNIRGNKIDVTKAINDYIEEKVSKLEKYLDDNEEVEAKAVISAKGKNQKVEVTIWSGKYNIRAEETNPDLYSAIDLVVDKLERQFKKYRGKLNNRKNAREEYVPSIEIELLGHSFFVFKNVDTDKINVVYKRKDGDYGVIEAN